MQLNRIYCSYLPTMSNLDKLNFVEQNPCQSTRYVVERLYILQSIVNCYLEKLRKVNKLGIRVFHNIREHNKEDCVSITTSLPSKCKNRASFKKQDYKWKITISSAKDSGLIRINYPYQIQK